VLLSALPLLLGAVSAPVVPAAPAAAPGSEISLSRQDARPGEKVTISGTEFSGCLPAGSPGSRVTLAWRPVVAVPGPYAPLGSAPVDGRGVFAGSFAVPKGARPGVYQVSASCARKQGTGRNLVEDTANLRVVHTGAPGAADAPAAGAVPAGQEPASPAAAGSGRAMFADRVAVVPLSGAGAAALLVGLVLWLARRRRRSRPREVAVDAVAVPGPVPEPRLRQVGIGRTVALRVEAVVEQGPQDVRWIREGSPG
jgi:hypothetical protein